MELCATTRNVKIDNTIPNGELKECLREYKLQDKVDALKNCLGVRDGFGEKDRLERHERKKMDTTSIKDCLEPPMRSAFQALVHELRDTVRSSYWNKEIGKTIYLPPHLPAGCDPIGTTFGKATTRDGKARWFISEVQGYGVAEIINPRDVDVDDLDVNKHYRKSHNDYYPSEQIDRKYVPPFDKFSSFGDAKKTADFTGKKVANCIRWYNNDPMSLVSRRLADYSNRTISRVGKVKNHSISRVPTNLTFGKNADEAAEGVADILKETSGSRDIYCSEYADKISNNCAPMFAMTNIAAGFSSERTDLPHVVVSEGASISDKENLGDQTSAIALVSPNVFTQLGLSHMEFFKIRKYDEIRSIFENIGVKFPGDSFDVIWKEGLRKDCTGGVCVETFRNLLGRLAMENYNNEES